MFRHGACSTETDKKPFFFTLTGLVLCLAGTVLCFTFGLKEPLALFAGFLLAVVTIAALLVLLALVTDRAYIEDRVLYMRYLFRKRVVPLDKIGKITYKEDVYSVFDKSGNLIGTINGKLTGIDSVILELDKNGINFV